MDVASPSAAASDNADKDGEGELRMALHSSLSASSRFIFFFFSGVVVSASSLLGVSFSSSSSGETLLFARHIPEAAIGSSRKRGRGETRPSSWGSLVGYTTPSNTPISSST